MFRLLLVATLAIGFAVSDAEEAHAQQLPRFTLTPSSASATIVPSPTAAVYVAGSGQTPTWTITTNCQNVGTAANFCEYQALLGAAPATPLQSIQMTYTVAGTQCRSATGTFTVTLSTTATALFQVNRSQTLCTASNVTFTVTGLTRTAYPASATDYARGVTIQGVVR